MAYSQLTSTDFYQCFEISTNVLPMIDVDSPVTVFNLIVSGIVCTSSALTSPLRTIDTSAPLSIVLLDFHKFSPV